MKKTPLKKISKKRQAILSQEAIQVKLMLEQCKGRCMICNQLPDWRGLMKNHTKDREHFVLSCYSCHAPSGVHKYLEV